MYVRIHILLDWSKRVLFIAAGHCEVKEKRLKTSLTDCDTLLLHFGKRKDISYERQKP